MVDSPSPSFWRKTTNQPSIDAACGRNGLPSIVPSSGGGPGADGADPVGVVAIVAGRVRVPPAAGPALGFLSWQPSARTTISVAGGKRITNVSEFPVGQVSKLVRRDAYDCIRRKNPPSGPRPRGRALSWESIFSTRPRQS